MKEEIKHFKLMRNVYYSAIWFDNNLKSILKSFTSWSLNWIFDIFRYVPAALEFSRNGEKSAAVSGGAFSFHDMLEHAHNLHPNGNEHSAGSVSRHHHHWDFSHCISQNEPTNILRIKAKYESCWSHYYDCADIQIPVKENWFRNG